MTSGLQLVEPFLNSCKPARELIQPVVAVARCSGSGLGPVRGGGVFRIGVPCLRALQKFSQIGGEHRVGIFAELGHRLEEARALLCKIGIGGDCGQLVFPEIEILARERGKVRLITHDAQLYMCEGKIRYFCRKNDEQVALQHFCASSVIIREHKQLSRPLTMASTDKKDPITIKKYANRRLYNTATSKYVTLDDLAVMVKAGDDFLVVDAKSGDDITRPVLTQIIFEEEAKGENLLPVSFLRQLIQFYGDSLQSVVPNYLEASMDAFSKNQGRMREYVESTVGRSIFPFNQLEELGRQNMAMFERAFQMFTPLTPGNGDVRAEEKPAGSGEDNKLDDLQAQIENLRRQLDDLSR